MKEVVNTLYKRYLSYVLDEVFGITTPKDKSDIFIKNYKVEKKNFDYIVVNQEGNQIGDKYSQLIRKKNYDVVRSLSEGWSFLDENGNPVNDIWFDDINWNSFPYKVCDNKKRYNFINEQGKLISDIWFDCAWNFNNNVAAVGLIDKTYPDGYKYNYINKEGKLILSEWLDKSYKFKGGTAPINTEDGWYFIDQEGNTISNQKYNCYLQNYYGKYAIFKENDIHILVDITTSEKLATSDNIEHIADDVFLLKKEGEKRVIKIANKSSNNEWYESLENFDNNIYIAKSKKKQKLIDVSSNPICDVWFDKIKILSEDRFIVKIDENSYIIDRNGNVISNLNYESIIISEKKCSYVIVKQNGKYNIIDKNGNLLLSKWYDEISFLYSDSVIIKDGNKEYEINISLLKVDLKGYNVKKTTLSYKCSKGNDSFKIKYKPIKVFNERYILCRDNNSVYLYDRNNKKYEKLGTLKSVNYYDNLVTCDDTTFINFNNDEAFLITNDNKIDISDYYNENLKYMRLHELNISPNNIYTKEEFYYQHQQEIDDVLNRRRKNLQEEMNSRKVNQEQQELSTIQKQKKIEDIARIEEQKNALRIIAEQLDRLNQITEEAKEIIRIPISNVLVDIDNHKEINPFYIASGFLKHIDFSNLYLENVKLDGIDFTDTNIYFNPQKVYNKSLRNCHFEGAIMDYAFDFSNIDIRGTSFVKNSDSKITMMPQFSEAIYDETTTINGRPLTEIYGKCKKTVEEKPTVKSLIA